MGESEVESALKEVLEKITQNNVEEVKLLLSLGKVTANTCDEHGMSLIQHAAYKGSRDIVQLLLDQGASVNDGNHEHQYTALHFAALSGNVEVCQLLLNYGAKTQATNSVGRTASQMAAFVGNHSCVAVINNFIKKSEVEYFAKPETGPKLPPILVDPLHNFVIGSNVHPVKIAMTLKKSTPLYVYLESVRKILEEMSENEIKKEIEPNEVMSFKLHYFAFVVAEIAKLKKLQDAQQSSKTVVGTEEVDNADGGKKADAVEVFIKKMLRVGKNGENPEQNSFLVDAVRSFHTRTCATFRQMVSTLARSDAPSPLSVVVGAINGHRGFTDNIAECWTCGEIGAMKMCSKCKGVQYCDRECQRLHWFVHKKHCNRPTTSPERGKKIDQRNVQQAVESVRSQFANAAVN